MGEEFGRDSSRSVEVLLIEDNPGDARLAHEFFKNCQTKVNLRHVSTGTEAVSMLTRDEKLHGIAWPDLILLDLSLPGVGGAEVLKVLRADGRLASVPIIVMTTSVAPEDARACYELQANAYIIKPHDLDELFEAFLSIEKFWLRAAELPGASQPPSKRS